MNTISWDALRALLLVAEHGSLTHAAGKLGVSVATLGRRIDGLEAELGLRLLRRGPQGAKLTRYGQRVLDLIKPGAERFDELARLAKSLTADARQPPVRISSTEPLIADVLARQVPLLLDDCPDIRVELETSMELSNLNRGDADIAVRMLRPGSDTLITRRLTTIRMGLFASPAYLAAATPVDLRTARLLWYDSALGDIAENQWLRHQGLEQQVVLRAGSVRALMLAAEAGLGIAPAPHFLAQTYDLVQLEQPSLPDRTPWLVFHRDTRGDARLRAVRDWIAKACRRAISAPP